METERGITEVFRMVSKGDSIELKMRAKDVFLFMWRMDPPASVDPESQFTYRIVCKDIFDDAGAKAFTAQRDSIHGCTVVRCVPVMRAPRFVRSPR